MTDQSDLIVQVYRGADDDERELLRLTEQLRTALLDLGVDDVDTRTTNGAPDGSKAAGLVESLAVKLGIVTVTKAVGKIRQFAGLSGRSVKVCIDGDYIELTGVTTAQQQQLTDIWLAKHGPRP